ncbi:MAG: hypothetical protein GXY83_42380 [Rhodopirellula sp.]|nr:hypothetical protein [Rhodopirellula sp.]
MKAKLVALAAALVATPVLAFMGLYGYACYQDALRIQDAAPAFDPLEQIKPILLSQPFGSRYCRYVVDFPPESLLNDDNVDLLRSLNLLPEQNTLDVTIRTERITDASLSVLASLGSIDLLDVTETAITDEGIAQLQSVMPSAIVPTRERPERTHNNAVNPSGGLGRS